MSAVNPIQPPAPPARDQRAYEPSMEEILASIRRIIADDQSLPGRGIVSEPAAALAEAAPMPSGQNPTDVRVLRPVEVAADLAALPVVGPLDRRTAPAPTTPKLQAPAETLSSLESTSFAAHGTIAPQFPTPADPVPPEAASAAAPVPRDPQTHSAAGLQRAPGAASLRRPDQPEPRSRSLEPAAADGNHIEPDHAGNAALPAPSADQGMDHDKPVDYDKPMGRHEPIPFEPASLISPATDQALVAAFNMLAASRLTDNTDELLAMSREMIRPLLKTWLDDNLPSMVERLVRAEIERVARGAR